MSNSTKKKWVLPGYSRKLLEFLVSNWRVTLPLIVFAVFLVITIDWANQRKWREWTGFGQSTTLSEKTEKDAQGRVVKTTDTIQSGKTLWDWLELAGTLAVPVLLLILGYQLQRRDQERAEQQAKAEKERAEQQANLERETASANLRDQALQAYIDRMSDNPVRDVACIRTITILRRLERDIERQKIILQFLRGLGLFKESFFKDADLSGIDLRDADLRSANLSGVNLSGAKLSRAKLNRADLLHGAVKARSARGATLPNNTNLSHSNLSHADLRGADLRDADLSGAELIDADLRGADLGGANLSGEMTSGGADLRGADLRGADLSRARLNCILLSNTTNLAGADLRGAKDLMPGIVKVAQNWKQARYSPEFRQELGLPSETSENTKANLEDINRND